MHIHVYVYSRKCTYSACVYVCIYTHLQTDVYMHIDTGICIYVHIYICVIYRWL